MQAGRSGSRRSCVGETRPNSSSTFMNTGTSLPETCHAGPLSSRFKMVDLQ